MLKKLQTANDYLPATMPVNMEGIIWAHLAQLQANPNFIELLLFQEAIRQMDAFPFLKAIQEAPFL